MSERLDWLRWRQLGLGGSDLGQLPEVVRAVGGDPDADRSPWGGPWHVWASKRGEPDEGAVGADVMTGVLLEEAVIQWAVGELGGERVKGTDLKGDRGVLRGTPDALVLRGGELEGVEAKVSAAYGWEAPPVYYELQCRAYMYITSAPRWHLAVFFRRAPAWRVYTIERDLALEGRVVEAAEAWWQRHVVEGLHPEIDDTADCARGLALLHPRTAGTTAADFRVATREEIAAAVEVARLEEVAAGLDLDLRRARNELRARIGDDAGLRWTGGSVRWSRNKLVVHMDEMESDR